MICLNNWSGVLLALFFKDLHLAIFSFQSAITFWEFSTIDFTFHYYLKSGHFEIIISCLDLCKVLLCIPSVFDKHWIYSHLDAQRISNKTCQLLNTSVISQRRSSFSHAYFSGWSCYLTFDWSRKLDFILNTSSCTLLSCVYSIFYIFLNSLCISRMP